MKFRLKSLFLITLLVAILVGSITQGIRNAAKAKRLEKTVNGALTDLGVSGIRYVQKSQSRNDFVIYSSGRMRWNISIDDQSRVAIELNWRSKLWFAMRPSVYVLHSDSEREKKFSDEFVDIMQKMRPDIQVEVVVR